MYKLIAILENNVKTISDAMMLVIVVTISMGDSIFFSFAEKTISAFPAPKNEIALATDPIAIK